jgi:acetylornithine deacetylase/succinyl-diaminopimelate desuccinylase-like protein
MLTPQEHQVLDLIDSGRDEIVAYLRTLIGFKTVTPPNDGRVDHDGYRDLQNIVCDTLREMNFELDVWEADAAELPRFPGSGVDLAR